MKLFYLAVVRILPTHLLVYLGEQLCVVVEQRESGAAGHAQIHIYDRGAYTVYRAEFQPPGVLAAEQRNKARAHVGACRDSVCHREYALRRGIKAVYKITEPGHKRCRLAASGHGKKQHRIVRALHGLRLLLIELYAEFCRKFIITYHNPVIIPELRTAGNMIIPFVQKSDT